MFMNFAHMANQQGYSCVLFDHYGIGYSDGAYSNFRLSRAADDLVSVVTQSRELLDSDGSCVLVGQSLGTAVAALAEKKLHENLMGSVLWNLSANIHERYPELFGEGILKSDTYCLPEKGLLIGKSFVDDARRCDILGSFEAFATPVLFLSCTDDSMSDTSLVQIASSKAALSDRALIPGANHSFKCQPQLEQAAISKSLAWIERIRQ
jgi:pimeloyl-ACP methyl ester carboxylesterase